MCQAKSNEDEGTITISKDEPVIVGVEIVDDGKALSIELENVPEKFKIITLSATDLTTCADLATEL